jgi:TRAP-type C4-dicarboxylate transport system permease small subunit
VARISQLAACAFFVALAIVAWRYMQLQSFQKSASLRVPMLYVYSVIPACSAVMALISLLRAITGRDIHGTATPDSPPPSSEAVTPGPDTLPVTEDRP